MNKKNIRAVIYTRVSSESQEDNTSLEDQEARAKAYIISQGWKYVSTYSDVASGKSLEREGLNTLLSNSKKFDYVVVIKLDRLSRKLIDILSLVYKSFDTHKIAVVSVTEPFNTSTPQGRLLLNMLGSFAEYERELIKERVQAGKKAKAEKGGYIGGSPKLGQIAKNKELEEHKEELNLIRVIKYHRKSGKSLREICKFLDEKGYRTKRGGKWYPKTIANITG
jgi:site-specific DNA recombinase